MGTEEIAKLWAEITTTLDSMIIPKEKLTKMEKLLNQIKDNMADASKRGMLNNPSDAYEQLHVLARLGSTLENLQREMEELERLEKKMQALKKRIETDFLIMDQIREQLKKKLQIVVHGEGSELKPNPEKDLDSDHR
ncbi:MAG: hypothetical protein QW835_04555 [Candidatus Hadarchaeum sp.]|uniref:hypothetical protein n=1 Tax=Candidatus Hadarchaeum sp. TaxID=2883567 RepID=UPI00317EE48E